MQLKLPAPGVIAAVTLAVLAGAMAFTVWWPYQREQAVIQSLEQTGTVGVEYEYRGPAVFAVFAAYVRYAIADVEIDDLREVLPQATLDRRP